MKNCINHPEIESLSICRSCGNTYCESCLDEGKEYYYCKLPACQILLEKELPKISAPEKIICPKCETELELSKEERIKGKIHCPECESAIDFLTIPPRILETENYIEVISSLNQGDISLIKSILEDGEIDYYTRGENFLGVRPLLEPVGILVSVNKIEIVKELLKDIDLKIFGLSSRQENDNE